MIDTHAHLNFIAFKDNLEEVLDNTWREGVEKIIIPGASLKSSKRAVEKAHLDHRLFAAIGIHPHHVFEFRMKNEECRIVLDEIEKLLQDEKVVAVGEVGLDRYFYKSTRYTGYKVDDDFIDLQKYFFVKQIKLAKKYNKSLIVHNRGAADEVLELLKENWDKALEGHTVFHCAEANSKILEFAKSHNIFIGVDGDITYTPEKAEFIKLVPLEMIVLETDSPYLIPEPLRSQGEKVNTPGNLNIIAKFLAELLGKNLEEIKNITTDNAKKLFRL